MRQAFMRGVCALNLEAMKLMRNEDGTPPTTLSEDRGCFDDRKFSSRVQSPETVVRRALERAAEMKRGDEVTI